MFEEGKSPRGKPFSSSRTLIALYLSEWNEDEEGEEYTSQAREAKQFISFRAIFSSKKEKTALFSPSQRVES